MAAESAGNTKREPENNTFFAFHAFFAAIHGGGVGLKEGRARAAGEGARAPGCSATKRCPFVLRTAQEAGRPMRGPARRQVHPLGGGRPAGLVLSRSGRLVVRSFSEGWTAGYAIRTISGVGGALRKGRPYPDGRFVCHVHR